jgi:hypothetical protein
LRIPEEDSANRFRMSERNMWKRCECQLAALRFGTYGDENGRQ